MSWLSNLFKQREERSDERKVRVKKDPKLREAFSKVRKDFEQIESKMSEHQKILDIHSNLIKEHSQKLEMIINNSQSLSIIPINSHLLSPIIKNSQSAHIENIVIKKFKRARRPQVINKIRELLESGRDVIEIREDIVDRQRIIPQATFYRYVGKIENEMRKSDNENENKVRINDNKVIIEKKAKNKIKKEGEIIEEQA